MTNNRHLKSIVFFSLIITYAPIMSMITTKYPKKGNGRKTPPPTITTTPAPPSKTTDLEESRIITTVTTTRGFGLWRSAWDLVKAEEENLFADLQNKTFDMNNSSYHRKLSTAIEIYVNKKNDEKLTDIFETCRKAPYLHVIKIEDSPALMAHMFLVEQNKLIQQSLKIELEEADNAAIKETNNALVSLKKTIEAQIIAMNQQLATHNQVQEETIETECTDIKRLKKGLGNIHKLNKTFTKPDDAYCSDDEAQEPEDVGKFYSNTHILAKIGSDKKLAETRHKIQVMLAKLTALNSQIQEIQELRY